MGPRSARVVRKGLFGFGNDSLMINNFFINLILSYFKSLKLREWEGAMLGHDFMDPTDSVGPIPRDSIFRLGVLILKGSTVLIMVDFLLL